MKRFIAILLTSSISNLRELLKWIIVVDEIIRRLREQDYTLKIYTYYFKYLFIIRCLGMYTCIKSKLFYPMGHVTGLMHF